MAKHVKVSVKRAKGSLTKRLIAETALGLIDREGLEELSMRQLGAALGVEAMALYHYFPNKAELLDGVQELLFEEIEATAPAGLAPVKRLRTMFEGSRDVAIRHPRAFLLVPTRRFRTRTSLEFYERLLRTFHDAGLSDEASARYFRVLAAFTTGAGLAEIGSRAQQPDASPVILEDFSDPKTFPRVSAVVPHLQVAKLGRIFEFGLDLIFQAMEAEIAKTARRRG